MQNEGLRFTAVRVTPLRLPALVLDVFRTGRLSPAGEGVPIIYRCAVCYGQKNWAIKDLDASEVFFASDRSDVLR